MPPISLHWRFQPDDANPILPEGEYSAVVLTAESGETKQGDSKFDVTVKVYGGNGVLLLVTDHIISPYGIRRLKRLCETTGVDFDNGEVDPADFVGQNVRVRLRVEHDEDGHLPDGTAQPAAAKSNPAQGSGMLTKPMNLTPCLMQQNGLNAGSAGV